VENRALTVSGTSNRLSLLVDEMPVAAGIATDSPEVDYGSVLPDRGVVSSIRKIGTADDLARIVDPSSVAWPILLTAAANPTVPPRVPKSSIPLRFCQTKGSIVGAPVVALPMEFVKEKCGYNKGTTTLTISASHYQTMPADTV